jgi:hypothetical protein
VSRKVVGMTVVLALVPASAGGVAALGAADPDAAETLAGTQRAARAAQNKPVRFEASDLFISLHATDRDFGLLMNVEGDDWRQLTVRDPKGRTVLSVQGRGRLRDYGVVGMTFEGSEPPFQAASFRRFRARFPAGRYAFSGTTVEGRRLVGSDRLVHTLPAAPVILTPTKDAVVDPASVVVTWEPVTKPAGVKIAGYVVIVTAEASDRELTMELGPNATTAAIPADFLERGAAHKVELVVRANTGNQTITEVPFKTSG